MSPSHSLPTELAAGQTVILTARWILVLAGLLLTLLAPGALGILRFQLMVLLGLAVINFYLCAQVLTHQPTLKEVIYAASFADLVAITLVVIAQGGFNSNTYVFYFPALLAISVAFSTTMLGGFTLGVVGVYGLIGFLSVSPRQWETDLPLLVIRLLMLMAVVVCGYQSSRMENAQRAKTLGVQPTRAASAPAPEPLQPSQRLPVSNR